VKFNFNMTENEFANMCLIFAIVAVLWFLTRIYGY
jgi:hypothetical protein